MIKIILVDSGRDDLILQLRAAKEGLKVGLQEGEIFGVGFEDGSYYGVKRNKKSIRVYPQD